MTEEPRPVRLSDSARACIERHAEEGFPLEICGFLAGTPGPDGRSVREAWPASNAWESDAVGKAALLAGRESGPAAADLWAAASAERRYLVAPREVAAAMKRARSAGLDLVGVYHTHPNHPAVPSPFDLDAAWPEWSYIIVSVRDGRAVEFRSWCLDEASGQFVEEPVLPEA